MNKQAFGVIIESKEAINANGYVMTHAGEKFLICNDPDGYGPTGSSPEWGGGYKHAASWKTYEEAEKFAKAWKGAPCVDDEDVPEELRSTSCAPKENEWDTDDNWFKRWASALEEMIFAMQEISNYNENEPKMFKHVGDLEFGEIDERTGLGEIKSTGVELIPEMEQPNKEYHQRIQKGCVLFGKYFSSLLS